MGSGGGGGNWSTGANGGGAIVFNAGYLSAQGNIEANGGGAGLGGAGSGGSILLRVGAAWLGTNNIQALGGGPGPYDGSQGGGAGGVGRIAIYHAAAVQGQCTPPPYVAEDTNSDSIIITTPPASLTNFLGDTVSLTVAFTTFSPHSMQWNFNGTALPSATNQSLVITNVALTNQGFYSLSISNPVIMVTSPSTYLAVLDTNMPFADGIPNWWKLQYGLSLTDPTLATNHPAGDRLTYLEKYLYALDPLTTDTDGDGLSDYDEVFVYHSNPLSANTSGDGIPDGWKVQYGLNPLLANANSEAGFDGVTYMHVYQYNQTHTNQLDPRRPFALGPGLSNYEILNNGQHTNRFYYDHEDRLLGMESSRGISIAYIYDGNGNLTRQTVLSRAGETNGLPVLWSFLNNLTNSTPTDGPFGDADGDGWSNYQEWLAGTNPKDTNSVPSLLGNPGVNIGSLSLPFTPSNFVVGSGNLDGLPGDEIVIGADGNPGTNNNFLLVLTQTATNWSTQQVSVGAFGITSIAVGQPTNRPTAGIYVGLRGTNGEQVLEFTSNGGIWQSNVVTVSSNEAAFVGGIRAGGDLLVDLGTNGISGGLWSLTFSNTNWNSSSLSTNTSHRGLPSHGLLSTSLSNDSAVRLLDTNGIEVFSTNLWVIAEPFGMMPITWRGEQLALEPMRPGTNQSLLYCSVNDSNASTTVDPGDGLVFAEYLISNNVAMILTLTNVPLGSSSLSQSFALAAADFLGTGIDAAFTAEPNGGISSWSSSSSVPLSRQLFSADYLGKSWHGLSAVKMPAAGQGLVGLEVDPANPNTCTAVFWSPQAVLQSPQVSVIETAPAAAVIPSANPLGPTAVVTVRLWHAEGAASTPFLQYELSGATNWQNATLISLDGLPYSPTTRVSAVPSGSDHVLAWNAAADLGNGVVTNVLLRARAQDFMLTGDWSAPTPFQVNMAQGTNGIPSWWLLQYFGRTDVDPNADADGDGMSNYAEYIADTDPTDPNSNLRIRSTQVVAGGMAIIWQGGELSTQYLQQRFGLNDTNSWVDIFTNLPPTANPSAFTNTGATTNTGFFRIRVTR